MAAEPRSREEYASDLRGNTDDDIEPVVPGPPEGRHDAKDTLLPGQPADDTSSPQAGQAQGGSDSGESGSEPGIVQPAGATTNEARDPAGPGIRDEDLSLPQEAAPYMASEPVLAAHENNLLADDDAMLLRGGRVPDAARPPALPPAQIRLSVAVRGPAA